MRTAAIVAGLVLAASVMDVCRAATHPQDIAALWKFKEEALKMSDNNGSWKKVFESWTGRGEACPYPECPHDPCGEDWHGTWHGVQCRELQGVKQWTLPDNVLRRVTNLHIPEWGLPGSLPESVCLFEMLEELDFDENAFEGTLPACVGCLPHLREIDIEDNKFTGTIPKEWGNLDGLIEFEIDGNQLLAGCIPEGLPKDAEWCGDCWSTCPQYDPYCGAYDCNSCVTWTKDPEIGTSYENTRIQGDRCPNEPNPPICPWQIFKEEFEEQEKQKQQEIEEKVEEIRVRSRELGPSLGSIIPPAAEDTAPEPEVVEAVPEVEVAPVSEEIAPTLDEPEVDTAEVSLEEESSGEQVCANPASRTTVSGEECVFPLEIMGQMHCDCAVHSDKSWCRVQSGDWQECAPTDV
mmetsp:Transcript_1993/g.4530  ORF Transcript_1993/g.4530 Transcript_1993/m.4530 type:complete len:407 (+) Transcript_1993:318-1538(+)